MKKLISFGLLCTAGAVFSSSAHATFTYQNEPINPACVALFNSSMADFPYIKSINLNVCQHSQAAAKKTLKKPDGELYYYENDKDVSEGFYGYKVVGQSKNGIYVLSTYTSGGGTGLYTQLLLAQLKPVNLYVYDDKGKPDIQTIMQLNLLGYVTGGDRCSGSFSKVELMNNQLKIEKYLGETPNDCSKTEQFSINLEPLAP